MSRIVNPASRMLSKNPILSALPRQGGRFVAPPRPLQQQMSAHTLQGFPVQSAPPQMPLLPSTTNPKQPLQTLPIQVMQAMKAMQGQVQPSGIQDSLPPNPFNLDNQVPSQIQPQPPLPTLENPAQNYEAQAWENLMQHFHEIAPKMEKELGRPLNQQESMMLSMHLMKGLTQEQQEMRSGLQKQQQAQHPMSAHPMPASPVESDTVHRQNAPFPRPARNRSSSDLSNSFNTMLDQLRNINKKWEAEADGMFSNAATPASPAGMLGLQSTRSLMDMTGFDPDIQQMLGQTADQYDLDMVRQNQNDPENTIHDYHQQTSKLMKKAPLLADESGDNSVQNSPDQASDQNPAAMMQKMMSSVAGGKNPADFMPMLGNLFNKMVQSGQNPQKFMDEKPLEPIKIEGLPAPREWQQPSIFPSQNPPAYNAMINQQRQMQQMSLMNNQMLMNNPNNGYMNNYGNYGGRMMPWQLPLAQNSAMMNSMNWGNGYSGYNALNPALATAGVY